MTADELLSVFDDAAKAVRTALEPLTGAARRARTERPGQYALDLVQAVNTLGQELETPELKARVRERERLLFAMFPEYDV